MGRSDCGKRGCVMTGEDQTGEQVKVCVHVPAGDTSSASLPAEPQNMEWQQPRLCQGAGPNMIYFPLTYSLCITFIQPSIFFPHSPFMLRAQCQEQLSSAANV